uniref:Uncharacterized protein n=1 Tax=Oryza brachyantha TaxID=4533 RepID=J3N1U2_ORYBR
MGARECIGILHKSFKEVLDEEKELAWDKLKEKFDYPPEAVLALKRQALIKISISLKKFKSMLVNEYILNRVDLPNDLTGELSRPEIPHTNF